jgi:FK506-binding protein 2
VFTIDWAKFNQSNMLKFILIVALVAFVFAGKYDTGKLQVGVKFLPAQCDRKTKDGDNVSVHYAGSLTNGKEFDSSYKRNEPFKFKLGAGNVIKGWDLGMLGACVGEKRKLVIPASLGYGDSGAGADIPGGATLIFEVEIVAIN